MNSGAPVRSEGSVLEIRQDPTTREWVIIAREMAEKTNGLVARRAKPKLPDYLPSCPFCGGNESMTPPEILSYQEHKTRGWRVRVFPNRFPALVPEGSATRKDEDNFFLGMDGIGIHEVIVETPQHNKPLALMRDSGVADVLFAYQDRYNAVSQMRFVKQIIIFKNHGTLSGTSLAHPHSQLIAIPVVPRHIRMRHEVITCYYDDTGRCLCSDVVDHELRVGKRMVMETERFVVFHPFASHQPFETWIVPKVHRASFGKVSPEELKELAHVLRVTLLKLYRGLNDPDFNYVIDTAPVRDENKVCHLWHIRIVPRLIEPMGFELGSGIHINPAVPEETAQLMRELEVE